MARSWHHPLVLVLMGSMIGCSPVRQWEPELLSDPSSAPSERAAPYLKAHLHSGELVVLSGWSVPGEGDARLEGYGVRYSVDRIQGTPGPQSLPLDSVALLEANRRETVEAFAFAGLALWTGISTLITAACVSDPKACFGSCPTFYLDEGPSGPPVAEGFSASVARVLEANDVDALPEPRGVGLEYAILMRNEAPETHAIRSVHLLATRRSPGRLVYALSGGGFRDGSHALEPTGCTVVGSSPEINCSEAIRHPDGEELFSPADSTDLAAREWVEVVLPAVRQGTDAGILIRGRASLLSTFLFYQALAYAGENAGSWVAAVERGDRNLARRVTGIYDAVGPVDVLLEQNGDWIEIGSFGEAGPIAADEQVVALPHLPEEPVRIRLRMAKGAWRIDRVGLVELGGEVEPEVLPPIRVERISGAVPSEVALDRLLDPTRHLVTQRGDAYRIHFRLPAPGAELSLFLDSRGFYYEWMRKQWIAETSPAMLALLLTEPETALRRLAPRFKAREAKMEETFWSSRFRRSHR